MAPRPPTGLEMLLNEGSADEKYERLKRHGCLSEVGLARRAEVVDLIERTMLKWLRLELRSLKIELGRLSPPEPSPMLPSSAFWRPGMPLPSFFAGSVGLERPADEVVHL